MSAQSPQPPEGRLVRSTARPGLTSAGVAVLGGAVGIVAAVVSELVTDGLGWLFGIPFVLVSAYCAAEVNLKSLRSAVIMPPLVAFVAAAIDPFFAPADKAGIRGWLVMTLTTLTTMAPTLFFATLAAAAIVGWRYWRNRKA